MKLILSVFSILSLAYFSAQTKVSDTLKQSDIKEVIVIAKKPTVESKTDRTVFNVANSSILAGNTSWEVLQMTPLISIDNNDNISAEGESVVVYVNDRKSIFTGKQLKDYLRTIPADNLMKIEVITSPSSRYDGAGEVINIVLKKLENEGFKGSATFNNAQNKKNSQYSNLNLNYHKGNFTQSFTGGYGDRTTILNNANDNFFFANNALTKIITKSTEEDKSPSFSSASEIELNDKNTIGLILEFYQNNKNSFSNALGNNYLDNNFQNSYLQNQNLFGYDQNVGNNLYYKFYDKVKNQILDINLGFNYNSTRDTNDHFKDFSDDPIPIGTRINANNENREYYLKADYSQNLGTTDAQLEFGGKANFRNNVIPYGYSNLINNEWAYDIKRSNDFHYAENLNSFYANLSKIYFKKLETRIGLRYEYIYYKIRQDVGDFEKTNSYGSFLPDLLLKYSFSDNYNLSATYNRYLARPSGGEFNPFLLPNDDGTFYRGNPNILPNPNNRIGLKLGLFRKYFLSANYSFTNQDYWDSYVLENGNTITMPVNFDGRSARYSFNFNTNQTFFKNKININFNFGYNYTDNSDFNRRNNLDVQNYLSNFNGSTNISYTNLFNKNINVNAFLSISTQNRGNTLANTPSIFHNLSITKIFTDSGIETTLRLVNPFSKLKFDTTTYAPIGTFRNHTELDYHGISITLVKRFGNQKVKESSKTDVEKESSGK